MHSNLPKRATFQNVRPAEDMFLFVNPGSGGNKGKASAILERFCSSSGSTGQRMFCFRFAFYDAEFPTGVWAAIFSVTGVFGRTKAFYGGCGRWKEGASFAETKTNCACV